MKRIFATASLLLFFAACCLFSRSCANTTTAPSGGPKDTIPPVLIKVTPEQNSTGFPLTGGQISLLYDEYTVVKTPTDILLSPPTKKRVQAKVKGKNIVVSIQDTLKENQTYTIDFGQALVDNNEGNIAPRLVYAFSTGSTVDSMYFTGRIIDSKTLEPVKKALVTAYMDLSDSACFNTLPDAAVKTDDWGFFIIRNIKDTTYRIYAYNDEDTDYKYNPDADQIAFLDSVFTPVAVVNDSIFEFGEFNMKDTLKCKMRKPMVTMAMFKELQSVQYLQNSYRKSEKYGALKFSAANVQINSLDFFGIDSSAVILQYNETRDSLDFWINVDYRLEDSLLITVDYMKTDSTGVLSPFVEKLSLAVKEDETFKGMNMGDVKKVNDTTFNLTVDVKDETVEQLGVRISSDVPIVKMQLDSISLIESNAKGQETVKQYTMVQDSVNIRSYVLKPVDALVKGCDYTFKFPYGTFTNLDKLPNTEASAKFKIPTSEELSTLKLKLEGVDKNYLVELTGDKGGSALRTYNVDHDQTLTIPYLKAGQFMIRFTEDRNANGRADTGNLLKRLQPERVMFYETEPGNQILEIPESSEVEQTINIGDIFK